MKTVQVTNNLTLEIHDGDPPSLAYSGRWAQYYDDWEIVADELTKGAV